MTKTCLLLSGIEHGPPEDWSKQKSSAAAKLSENDCEKLLKKYWSIFGQCLKIDQSIGDEKKKSGFRASLRELKIGYVLNQMEYSYPQPLAVLKLGTRPVKTLELPLSGQILKWSLGLQGVLLHIRYWICFYQSFEQSIMSNGAWTMA